MIRELIERIKHTGVSFRFSLLMLFATLFVIGMLSLIILTYYRASQSLLYFSDQLMDQLSSVINQKIIHQINNAKADAVYSANLVESQVIDLEDLSEVANSTYNQIKIKAEVLPSVQSAFWADETGNFVASLKQDDGSIRTEILNRSHPPISQTVIFRDAKGDVIAQKHSPTLEFDPRDREWYQAIRSKTTPTVTDVFQYQFFGKKYWGITTAAPVFDAARKYIGFYALNIRIDYFSKFIENMKVTQNGKIFIVKNDGTLIVFPHLVQFSNPKLININALSIPWVVKSFNIFSKSQQERFDFIDNNKKYVAAYNPIYNFGSHKWYVGIVVPEDDFINELKELNYLTLAISILILLLALVIVSNLTKRIVMPLKRVIKETASIKRFELSGKINIRSRIKEIRLLFEALDSMKKGLRSFQKYVPASLVRHIIEAGGDAKIGGAVREIAILFTDIQDFTKISEQTKPDLLMLYLCRYFEELSYIISEEEGTIDKYIGDSIMAFWGAPITHHSPVEHAARAALRCVKRVSQLNISWIEKGMSPFVTRFGIHFGNAIVGNLGSSERMNYTAIGDAINIASRIEGINKIYGTTILVTEAVYAILKDKFVLRFIDCVILKGRAEINYIYEILAENRNELNFDIDQYNLNFAQAFNLYQSKQWASAESHFKSCLEIFAYDSIALLFIQRCEFFKQNPPPNDWNGVWTIVEK